MITYGTEHLSVDVFNSAFRVAQPLDQIVYAIGDLATSRHVGPEAKELGDLAKRAMHLSDGGRVWLTQRPVQGSRFQFGGGRCFEYIATRCPPKTSMSTPLRRNSSPAGALEMA